MRWFSVPAEAGLTTVHRDFVDEGRAAAQMLIDVGADAPRTLIFPTSLVVRTTFVYAYGFAEDIDSSHALYASLVMQMVRASEAYIGSITLNRFEAPA